MGMVLVIASGLLHAIWNLLAKRSGNPTVFLWSFQWVAVAAYAPWAIVALAGRPITAVGYACLFVTVMLHGAYVLLLSRTYALGDLSQVYPLMRGVSPVLVPIVGVAFLQESLPALGWLGVACIVTGIWMLGDWTFMTENRRRPRQWAPTATWWALAVGLAITCYTAFDKITLHYIPAVTLNDASNLGNLIALTWPAWRSGDIRREWQSNWRTILLGGILSPGGYLLFLTALSFMSVAQLAPMREIGTVFGTVLGITVLKEAQSRKRIAASIWIACGVSILAILG